LTAVYPNLRAALEWSLQQDDLGEAALRLASALGWFWYFRGLLSEGRALVKGALAHVGAQGATKPRAEALIEAARLASYQGDIKEATAYLREAASTSRGLADTRATAYALMFLGDVLDEVSLSEEAVALFRQVGDRWGLALALFSGASAIVWTSDDPAHALPLILESEAIFKELGDDWGLAEGVFYRALIARAQGNLGHTRDLLEKAVGLQQSTHDRWRIAYERGHLGGILHDLGDTKRAASLCEEASRELLALGDRFVGGGVVRRLAEIAFDQGDLPRARRLFLESVELFREAGHPRAVALTLCGLAQMASAAGEWERAARLFGGTDRQRREAPGWYWRTLWARYDAVIATTRRRLGEQAFTRAWETGQTMALEQAIADALSLKPLTEPVVLTVQLLDGFAVRMPEAAISPRAWRRRRDRLLFIYLVIGRKAVEREVLLETLWPDLPPSSAGASLNVAWANLKRALEPGLPEGTASSYLVLQDGRYGLRWERLRTDVQEFEEAVVRSQQLTDPTRELAQLEAATTYYRGDLLPDEVNEPWTMLERERLRALYLTTLDRLAAVQMQLGRRERAEDTLRSILQLEPWREETYRTLMRLLAELGRRSEAIRLYRECATLLRKELDVSPSAETKALFESISSR